MGGEDSRDIAHSRFGGFGSLLFFLFFLVLRIRWWEDGYGVMCYYLSLYPWFLHAVSYHTSLSVRNAHEIRELKYCGSQTLEKFLRPVSFLATRWSSPAASRSIDYCV